MNTEHARPARENPQDVDSNKDKRVLQKTASQQTRVLQPKSVHPALSSTLNIWTLLQALKKRWLPATVIGLLCAGVVGGAMWYFAPEPGMVGRSTLRINSVHDAPLPVPNRENFQVFRNAQVALIRSRFVLNAALRKPEVAKLDVINNQVDPVRWLEQQIRIDFPLGPEFIRVSMESKNSEDLKTLLNAVVKTYLDEFANKEHKDRQDQLERLKNLAARFNEKIEGKKKVIRELHMALQASGGEAIGWQQQVLILDQANARTELAGLRAEVRRLQVKIDIHHALQFGFYTEYMGALNMVPALVSPMSSSLTLFMHSKKVDAHAAPKELDPAVEDFLQRSPEMLSFADEIKKAKDNIKYIQRVMPQNATEAPSDLLDAKKRFETLLAGRNKREKELRLEIAKQIREHQKKDVQMSLFELRQQRDALQKLAKVLGDELAELADKTRGTVKKALDLDDERQAVERWGGVSENISRQIEALEVAQMAPARVTLMEEAVVYPGDGKKTYLMAGFAGTGTFGFILFCFAWWEFRSRRIYSSHEVVHDLGINLVGTLPDSSQNGKSRKYGAHTEQILIDSVDAVRTMILFTAQSEKMQILMVTSAMAGEGKTTSASHLAASLSRVGHKTLLIDCDLRKPNLHHLFELPITPGLSEALRDEEQIENCVSETAIPNLYLLSTGQSDLAAITNLSKKKIGDLLESLRETYDFIVVDSSPVLPVPDAANICQHVDGVIFSILRDVSQLPKVYFAYQRISDLGARILGAVVNGSQEDAYSSGYYYYHHAPVAG